MTKSVAELASEIQGLSDVDKLKLVDSILADLDRPDPDLDRIWTDEARKRWDAYRAGPMTSEPYANVMEKYRAP